MLSRRYRKVWEHLAAFANSRPADPEELRDAILWFVPWPVRCEGMFEYEGRRAGFIALWLDEADFVAEIAEHVTPITHFLQWIAQGENYLKKSGTRPLAFIPTVLEDIKLSMMPAWPAPPSYQPIGNVPFPRDMSQEDYADLTEETSKWYQLSGTAKGSLLSKGVPLVPCKDYVKAGLWGPIIDFFMMEVERMRQDGRKPPVFICEQCKKFYVPLKIRQDENKFCSPSCKTLDQKKRNPPQKPTYDKWLRRAMELEREDRREYMRDPNNMKRLWEIEALGDSLGPACVKRAKRLRAFC